MNCLAEETIGKSLIGLETAEPRILIVDDEASIRHLFVRILETRKTTCIQAADAAEAREFLKKQPFDLVLCDIGMPGESGLALMRYLAANYPETAVIMVTGIDDPAVADAALEIGAYGYIVKPVNPNCMIINVSNALRRRELETRQRNHCKDLEKLVFRRTEDLRQTMDNLQKAMSGIIEAMGITVEKRDPYTAGHQERVTAIATAIAKKMGLSENKTEGIRLAGLIHDIGKIAVPAEILNKPGQISDHEFGIIRSHAQVGYDIIKKIDFPWPIAQIVYQHHERLDGSGYPRGLSGNDILLEAKIIAVADVVEAMASHRPYRPALGFETALKEIRKNSGRFFAPSIVDTCCELFESGAYQLDCPKG
jgi:putative two-component system response regulator